jgi:hypothetical protein
MSERLDEENLEDQSQETEEELKPQEQEEISIEQLFALTNLNNEILESLENSSDQQDQENLGVDEEPQPNSSMVFLHLYHSISSFKLCIFRRQPVGRNCRRKSGSKYTRICR